MEMGAVLKYGPSSMWRWSSFGPGGDLCLICRQEELVVQAYEALVREAEQDRRFARQVAESSGAGAGIQEEVF